MQTFAVNASEALINLSIIKLDAPYAIKQSWKKAGERRALTVSLGLDLDAFVCYVVHV